MLMKLPKKNNQKLKFNLFKNLLYFTNHIFFYKSVRTSFIYNAFKISGNYFMLKIKYLFRKYLIFADHDYFEIKQLRQKYPKKKMLKMKKNRIKSDMPVLK